LEQRVFIFLIAVSLFTKQSVSQVVKWSEQLNESRKTPYMKILGEDVKENFFVLMSNFPFDDEKKYSGLKSRVYSLQYYNADFRLLWDKEFLTSVENGFISDVKMINGKIMVAGYNVDKKKGIYTFYTQCIDELGKWQGSPLYLDTISSNLLDEDSKPGFIHSRDQSMVAFSFRLIDDVKKKQSVRIAAVDTTMNLRYKREIEIPFSYQDFELIDNILTNSGSFYVIGFHRKPEKKSKTSIQNYYELYGYNTLIDQAVNTTIRSENRYLTEVGITSDDVNRSIVIAGFYSEKTTYSSAGVFYYALTEDSLKETKTINTPFDAAYLRKFLGEKKEERELVNYSIDRLRVRKDGGVGLIAESKFQSNRSYYDYYLQSFISHTYYHYGNIMVLSVNPDGNILWNILISKDQNSVDDDGYLSSYFGAVTGGRLVVLFNKYIDAESSVIMSSVDATGMQKTETLFGAMEKVYIIPRSGKQISEDTFLIPAYKKKKFYMIRITL
jgi:hypothetical protein